MRPLTEEELIKVLEKLAHSRFGAEMMLAEAVCYGGQLEEYRDAKNYVTEVIEAFPKEIREQYDALVRKRKADVLRKQADRIEAGTEIRLK